MDNQAFKDRDKPLIQSSNIGQDTTIAPFTIVQEGAIIGDHCSIASHGLIESGVAVGNRVTIGCGVYLRWGMRIEDDVTIDSNVSFANQEPARLTPYASQSTTTTIRKGASIGAGAVILKGLIIGERAQVQAGAVVTRSVPPKAVVVGNPATIIGYTDTETNVPSEMTGARRPEIGITETSVKGVTLHRFPFISDMRGNLVVGEFERTVPFIPKRYFMVLDVPSIETRGEHAHHHCHQFLISLKGTCSVVADDGYHREQFTLDRPDMGLYLPSMTWGIQYNYSSDAVLLVFASDYYDADDYIRDYDEFIHLVRQNP